MSFQLTILGASGAIPAYGRFTTAQHLLLENRHFLIDCGEGTQHQLSKVNIPVQRISHIFVSHLHGDHYLGLMGLLFSMHLNHREAPLHLYSFKGLDEIILAQLKYSRSTLNYELCFHELTSDRKVIFSDDVLTVETIPMDHRIPCCGFLFREKPKPRRIAREMLPDQFKLQDILKLKSGSDIIDESGKILYYNKDLTLEPRPSRSYAYCSDTRYNPLLGSVVAGVDLLYHEATFMDTERTKAADTFHSTAIQAATLALSASVKKLIIGHFSARYRELDGLLAEAQSIFPSTELAIECRTFEIDA
jgi:ribonuclease Z